MTMSKSDRDLDEMRATMARFKTKSVRLKIDAPDTSLATVTGKRNRSQSARKSKTKGSSYERRQAKKWGAWSGETLRRTPLSGGWGGGVAHGVSGDLVCDRKKFPFHIECKKRENWTLEDLILGVRASINDTRSVIGWWRQTVRTCPAGKIATLVFARNHVPDLIMMYRTEFLRLISKDFTAEFIPHYVFTFDTGEVVIAALDDFFRKVRPPRGCRNRKTWKAPGE